MNPAPVILFVYNRPQHSLRTLEALSSNDLADDSTLIIYADGPKENAGEEDLEKIRQTREIIRSRKWFGKVEIRESEINRGLARSVIRGVTEAVDEYGRVIVLEDDLITARGFLKYMNAALEKYQDEGKVMQISGYFFPVKEETSKGSSFFLPFTTSWGWAVWKRAWDCFDADASGYEVLKTDKRISFLFDLHGSYPYTEMILRQMEGKGIDSWAIRWWWSVFKSGGRVLYPSRSLVQNIGFGKDATHTFDEDGPFNSLSFEADGEIHDFPGDVENDEIQYARIKAFLSSGLDYGQNQQRSPKHLIKKGIRKIVDLFGFR